MAVARAVDEGTLEKVIYNLLGGELRHVLVCTTVIESGVDSAHGELVVDRATCWGWASSTSCGAGWAGPQRAYAYLFHPRWTRCFPSSRYERLRTIGDATRVQDRPAGDSGGRATCWAGTSRPRRRQSMSDELGGSRVEKADHIEALLRPATPHTCRPPTWPPIRLRRPTATSRGAYTEEDDDVRTEWEDRFGPLRRTAPCSDVARRWVDAAPSDDCAPSSPATGMGRSPDERASVKLSPMALGGGARYGGWPRGRLPGRPAPAAGAGGSSRRGTDYAPGAGPCSPSSCAD